MAQFQILSRDRAVSIATRYGLDGPGIESRQPLDLPNPLHNGYRIHFRGVKLLEVALTTLPHLVPGVKKE
jgi:hypothetical protein